MRGASKLKEASNRAFILIRQQVAKYPEKTGRHRDSFVYTLDGLAVRSQKDFDRLDERSTFMAHSTVPYASTAESRALNVLGLGGILFWVAKKLQGEYPDLGVAFEYERMNDLGHYYQVPRLVIGDSKYVKTHLVRPGHQHKRRVKEQGRRKRIVKRLNSDYGSR